MKKITRKELCELSRFFSTEVPLEEVIAVVEALGIKVVDCNDSRLINEVKETMKGLGLATKNGHSLDTCHICHCSPVYTTTIISNGIELKRCLKCKASSI